MEMFDLDSLVSLALLVGIVFIGWRLWQLERNRKDSLEHANNKLSETVDPIEKVNDMLEKYQENLEKFNTSRSRDQGELMNQIKTVMEGQEKVREQAEKLAGALRVDPKAAGDWGEMLLETVLEQAGMIKGTHYYAQKSMSSEEGRIRPDTVIRIPGGTIVVVDVKTSTSAYIRSIEENDQEQRKNLLKQHTENMRARMKELAKKEYWNKFDNTPDFVVMFVPLESAYAAAMREDPSMFDAAIKKNVLFASPTTFLALAKTVAYSWREAESAREAKKIADLGRELCGRLKTMNDHVKEWGKHLNRAVVSYGDFIGSLNSRVLPCARELKKLAKATEEVNLSEPEPVQTPVRGVVSTDDDPDTDNIKESS